MIELITGGAYNIGAFIFVIGTLVFVHEFGHYFLARKAGVKVEVFSLGFGKELFRWVDKNGTHWKICLIPVGGYVKMFGDKNAASTPDFDKIKELSPEEKNISFHTKSLPWKMAIVAAGPVFNYIFSIIIITILFSMNGKPISDSIIAGIEPGSVAEKTGLREGDKIVIINNKQVETFSDIQRIVSMNVGQEIAIEVLRDEAKIKFSLIPDVVEKEDMLGNKSKRSKLGIMSGHISIKNISISESVIEAIKEAYVTSASTLEALSEMVTGKRGPDDLSGPIRIAKFSGQSFKHGYQMVFWLLAILSINLGLMNLLPIPTLDGGHLFFYIIEWIKGSPVPEKYQQISFQIGLFLLFVLFIFTTFNDIKNIN